MPERILVGQVPVFVPITAASLKDMKVMDHLAQETGARYILDRGYLDCERHHRIGRCPVYFVIRAKSNLRFKRMYLAKTDGQAGVLCDQIGRPTGFYTWKGYPQKLRRVNYYDKETNGTFVFLTNNLEATALELVQLYKNPWQIEPFFKWSKQPLRINPFGEDLKMR